MQQVGTSSVCVDGTRTQPKGPVARALGLPCRAVAVRCPARTCRVTAMPDLVPAGLLQQASNRRSGPGCCLGQMPGAALRLTRCSSNPTPGQASRPREQRPRSPRRTGRFDGSGRWCSTFLGTMYSPTPSPPPKSRGGPTTRARPGAGEPPRDLTVRHARQRGVCGRPSSLHAGPHHRGRRATMPSTRPAVPCRHGSRHRNSSSSAYLNRRQRRELPDSAYAFPRQRKEPLSSASHVRTALSRFDQVSARQRR